MAPVLTHPISLATKRPFAAGKRRRVFAFPANPSMVVKVVQPRNAKEFAEGRLLSAFTRHYYLTILPLRELGEYTQLLARGEQRPYFIPEMFGMVNTDFGFGLAVEAIRGQDGDYAPTLSKLMREGQIDEEALMALRRFCADVEGCSLIIGDLHASNVVYAYNEKQGPHFVLVDGLGDKTFVPLLKLLPFLNRLVKRRKARKLLAKVEQRNASIATGPEQISTV